MNVTHGPTTPPMSKKWDGNVIQNPEMVKNRFTPANQEKAASVLRIVSDEKIADVKDILKKYDFSFISTNELKEVGNLLYENGLIDDQVRGVFGGGRGAFDEDGIQIHMDEKFNAIALFYEDLEGTLGVSRASPESRLEEQEGYRSTVDVLTRANRALNSLVYFSNSANNDLSVSETA